LVGKDSHASFYLLRFAESTAGNFFLLSSRHVVVNCQIGISEILFLNASANLPF
jgi:hypothetical protein